MQDHVKCLDLVHVSADQSPDLNCGVIEIREKGGEKPTPARCECYERVQWILVCTDGENTFRKYDPGATKACG